MLKNGKPEFISEDGKYIFWLNNKHRTWTMASQTESGRKVHVRADDCDREHPHLVLSWLKQDGSKWIAHSEIRVELLVPGLRLSISTARCLSFPPS
jgi:hypothetical protein